MTVTKINYRRKLIEVLDRSQWSEVERYLTDAEYIYIGNGKTALHWATYYNAPVYIVDYILKKYPYAALIQDNIGFTPLHYSTIFDDEAVIKLLVETEPEAVASCSKSGETPLNISILRRSFDNVAIMLRASPASLTKKNSNGDTAIDYFSRDWHFLIKKYLRKMAENSQGKEIRISLEDSIGNRKIHEILEFAKLILTINNNDENEKSVTFLQKAIINSSFSWKFCELLMLVFPEELERLGSDIFDVSAQDQDKDIYKKSFVCNKCSLASDELFDIPFGGMQCSKCAGRHKKGCLDSSEKVVRDDGLEKVQFLYSCLRNHPHLCSIN